MNNGNDDGNDDGGGDDDDITDLYICLVACTCFFKKFSFSLSQFLPHTKQWFTKDNDNADDAASDAADVDIDDDDDDDDDDDLSLDPILLKNNKLY